MNGETDLSLLLKTMQPVLHAGVFVFCVIHDPASLHLPDVVMLFQEEEGYTVILPKERADQLQLAYSYEAAWITLNVHSALHATGFTAAFSAALSAESISCNVVAANYHDHIFVDTASAQKAMQVLQRLAAS
jgi:uncharacterized protein